MAVGKSVRLFLSDGTPGGLLTAEIMNWTGHVVAAPRSDLARLLGRAEMSRTGIYFLLGDDPEMPGRMRAYIGEGDEVGRRLYDHGRTADHGGKDFWERAVVLTSKDMNLTKAHARYLEARLISIAQEANRATLTNATTPPTPPLPEADISDMEYFIGQAKIVLAVLGINLLRTTTSESISREDLAPTLTSESPVFILRSSGADATAQEVDGEFIVRKDSKVRSGWVGVNGGYQRLRQQLEEDETLRVSSGDGRMTFTRDYVFTSPSAASAVVLGRSSNGRQEWRRDGGDGTYGDWQEQNLTNIDVDDEH